MKTLLNFSFFQPFINNPSLGERINLFITNFSFLTLIIICLTLLFIIIPKKFQKYYLLTIMFLFFITPFLMRTFFMYAYDTPLGLLSIIADITILLIIFYKIGDFFINTSNSINKLTLGLVFVLLISFFSVFLKLNYLLNRPTIIIHFIVTTTVIIIFVGNKILKDELNFPSIFNFLKSLLKPEYLILLLVILLPLAPYLFTPAPPDADITTQSEIMGYIFQGKTLHHASTGYYDEWFFIRYPAGLSSFGWGIAQLLNLRASEALLLIWFLSYFLLIMAIRNLARLFKLNIFIILLFSLNLTITGYYGLTGGQVQEMLAYFLGLQMIYFLITKKINLALLILSAGIIVHPIVSLPFLLVFLVNFMKNIIKKERHFHFIWGGIILCLSIIYIIWLGSGQTLYLSQPAMLLKDLTPTIFINNLLRWLNNDTFYLSFFFIFLFLALFGYKYYWQEKEKQFFPLFLLITWFLGANLINGLFGSTAPYHFTATFQASFSVIGIWILSVGLGYKILITHFPQFQKSFFILFILIWLFFLAPGFHLTPVSVFINHSDIRMCRYLEKIIKKDDLVANITPISQEWGTDRNYYSFIRGNSRANTLFARIGAHEIKNGKILNKSFNSILALSDINQMIVELRKKNINYLLILARPETAEFVNKSKLKPIKNFGLTFLFKL